MPVFQPRPSAYDPRRRPPTGRNANPNGAPLNPYQMEQWNKSRREAANDYAYQNRGLQNPVSPAVAREAGPGAYLLTGGQGGRSDLEYDGDNNTSYYGAQAAPVSPINNDHAVGRPRTAAPAGLVPQGIQALIDGYRALPQASPFRYTDTEGEGSEGPVRDRSMMSSGPSAAPVASANPVNPGYVSPSAYDPNRQAPTGKNANPDGTPLNAYQMEQWNASRGEAARDAAFWAQAERRRAAANAAGDRTPTRPGAIAMLAELERRVGQGVTPQQNPVAPGAAPAAPYAGPSQGSIREGALPGTSTQAGRRAGNLPWDADQPMIDGVYANGYNGLAADPNRISSEEKFSIAQRAAQMDNPVRGRFPDARAIGVMESGVEKGSMYRIPQGYGTQPEYHQINQAPEVGYKSNKNGDLVSFLPPSSDPVLARQNAMMKKPGPRYIPLTPERRAEKAAEKAAETQRRADVKFKHLVSQGMNPLSPKARGMFPEQVSRMKAGVGFADNPVVAALSPTAPDTPENRKLREDTRVANTEASPTLKDFGVTPDMTPTDFAEAVSRGRKTSDISDGGLEEIFNQVKTYAADSEGNPPFNPREMGGASSPDMWNELWAMPVGTSPTKIRDWFNRYTAEVDRRIEEEQIRINTTPGW